MLKSSALDYSSFYGKIKFLEVRLQALFSFTYLPRDSSVNTPRGDRDVDESDERHNLTCNRDIVEVKTKRQIIFPFS